MGRERGSDAWSLGTTSLRPKKQNLKNCLFFVLESRTAKKSKSSQASLLSFRKTEQTNFLKLQIHPSLFPRDHRPDHRDWMDVTGIVSRSILGLVMTDKNVISTPVWGSPSTLSGLSSCLL